MTRLTDEELADVTERVVDGRCAVCRNEGNVAGRSQCAACDGTGAFALSTRTMCSVLAELRTRRAMDLTDEERDALEWCRILLNCDGFMVHQRHDQAVHTHVQSCERALSALDRLLSPPAADKGAR